LKHMTDFFFYQLSLGLSSFLSIEKIRFLIKR